MDTKLLFFTISLPVLVLTGCPTGDDDDTADEDFSVTIRSVAPMHDSYQFVGDLRIFRNDEVLKTCPDTDYCEAVSPYPDLHKATFDAWNVMCFDKEYDITDGDDGTTVNLEFDFYADCGLAPEGTYDAYDAPCGTGGEKIAEDYEVYTDFYNEDGTDYILIYGLIGSVIVSGDSFESYDQVYHGDLSDDLSEIYFVRDDPLQEVWFCLFE
ncbi:hypothetical protein KJ910_00620 [Patescibacteria group bacterium]|nr:hypothetical protein [Patescibacteria group bacterium]MBU1906958.1 hypothetical protein [Patescibacteria group bacterium]